MADIIENENENNENENNENEFLEVLGGENSDDDDVDGGDEFFTFGGGVIDVDEIFGGIDTDLPLDGGGTGIDISKKVTVDPETGETITVREFQPIDSNNKPIGSVVVDVERSPIIEHEEPPQLDKGNMVEKQDEQKNPLIEKEDDEDDKVSVHSFKMGGGHESVCAKIVELLPELFDPIHDK